LKNLFLIQQPVRKPKTVEESNEILTEKTTKNPKEKPMKSKRPKKNQRKIQTS
jgi:hypothetical protein